MRLVKVGLAAINTTVGAFGKNVDRAVGIAREMASQQVTVAVFPEQGTAPRHIPPPVAGNPCGVAAHGSTIWVMRMPKFSSTATTSPCPINLPLTSRSNCTCRPFTRASTSLKRGS
jgi:hypothetical protein